MLGLKLVGRKPVREEKLNDLRNQVMRMGGLAEEILDKAIRSLVERREELAAEVQEDDLEIDSLDVGIDETVLALLALEAPKAEDLRATIAMKMIATDLERVGDLARNIGKSAMRMARRPQVPIPPDLEQMGAQSQLLLRQALDAFTKADCEEAREVIRGDDAVDQIEDDFIRRMIDAIPEHPEITPQEIDFILVAKHLERVADHATNIAEDVILLNEARIVKHEEKLKRRARGGIR
jgi:phosphate transport system protein